MYSVLAGTIFDPFVGVTCNVSWLHIAAEILAIIGLGATTTDNVKLFPVHPFANGVTV